MKITKIILVPTLVLFFSSFAFALSDAEIAEIMTTANHAEIDAAKLAKKNAADGSVKDFAEHMISQHEQNLKDNKKVTQDEKIKSKSNDEAKSLKKDAKDHYADLKKKKGLEFDKAYIENQINMHQQLLTDLNDKLIPQAQNPQFKSFLMETKTTVEQHLVKAKEIQSTLK